ncbi:serine protease [Rhodoflexus caldus]|uniref:serine protease n=1 Tax=Rhodoflexus caldus TaxID=2891236 RepID=UPI00202A9295|nr:serine protease [Rhodoflexus caldus]
MNKKQFFLLILFFLTFNVNAQYHIHYFGKPMRKAPDKTDVPTFNMAFFDAKNILASEEANNRQKSKPTYQFGKTFDVSIDLLKQPQWKQEAKGRVFRYRIKAEGAKSISFAYKKFFLAENAWLKIYTPDSSMVMGPIAGGIFKTPDSFATDLLIGDESIIELFEPEGAIGTSVVQIEKVTLGYRDYFAAEQEAAISNGRTETALACQRNVICESNYTNESNAVALCFFGEDGYTGQLINNSGVISNANSQRPYFITAFHSIELAPALIASSTVFRFKYRSSQCNNNIIPPQSSWFVWSMGADVRAIHEATDVALLELRTGSLGVFGFNQMLANNGIWYLGWSRYNCGLNTSAAPVACLHHPRGDLMKISLSRLPVTTNLPPTFQIDPPYNPVNFNFVTFNSGSPQTIGAGTQPGSSGSGLLDQNKRLIGVLTGGAPVNPSCNNPDYSYYGRFDLAWEGGGTPNTRLKDWLDPGNLNVMTLNSSPANSTTTAGSPNFPVTNLISVSGAGMSVCQSGLGLGVIYV